MGGAAKAVEDVANTAVDLIGDAGNTVTKALGDTITTAEQAVDDAFSEIARWDREGIMLSPTNAAEEEAKKETKAANRAAAKAAADAKQRASDLARQRYSDSKKGKNNPNHKGYYKTPWGLFESSRLASKACPDQMSDVAILNFCRAKNSIPISYLSICRSKGYLNHAHIGLTPKELGFGFQINNIL